MKDKITKKARRKHATQLAQAAKDNLEWSNKSFADDPHMIEVGKNDYSDLMNIVRKIEDGDDKSSIARAMWRLDTIVRDVIPDSVYNAYNE